MRAVPLVLVLFWFFLLMPEVLKIAFGLDHPVMIGANLTAIITFVLFEAAYFAEIMRAGIQSIGRGQFFAATGLGLTYGQTMRYVILPQAHSEHAPSTADADNHSFPGYKPCLCNQRQRLHGRSCQDRPARRPAGFDVLFRSSLLPFSIVISFDADSSSADEDVRGALNAPNPVRLWPS